jgi:hypothetical protein
MMLCGSKTMEKLPTAIGTDVGTETFPRLIVNSALWYLYLQQEFVYVGDGIIEPSGKTRRMGLSLDCVIN